MFLIVKFLRDGSLDLERANPFQSGVVFHIETIFSNCTANETAGSYKKCNTGVKLVNQTVLKLSCPLHFHCSFLTLELLKNNCLSRDRDQISLLILSEFK